MKEHSRAKTRLSGLLTPDERMDLVCAMFDDVARAVAGSKVTAVKVVLTSSQWVIDRARSYDLDVMIESSQISESDSVDRASGILKEEGIEAVLRLPADVPLVKPEDIDELILWDIPAPSALIVPSCDGKGTNAIIRAPADIFRSRFGPNSFELHKKAAQTAGAAFHAAVNDRIGLDIDEPADVKNFMESGYGTITFDLLFNIGVLERM